MRRRSDLSGWWDGRLEFVKDVDVEAPAGAEGPFYVPLPWNKQIEHLRWPAPGTELANAVRPIQNQNFRLVHRKFNEGIITYRRRIELPGPPADPGQRAWLVFEGSNYRTDARVNGRPVGSHEGGHLAFEFDVTDALTPGANELVVTVDNLRRKDACPQEQFNWMNYGGMHRPVYLEWRAEPHIRRLAVTPGRDPQGWYADVAVTLSQATDASVAATIRSGTEIRAVDLSGPGNSRTGRIRMTSPVIWEVNRGGMSTCTACVRADGREVDRLAHPFGFRTVSLTPTRVEINGRPVRILGAAWHEYHPTFGNSVPGWQVTHDIRLMKQVGLNAIRAAHYPHSQEFYDACDREGILVAAELPCWQFNEYHFARPAMRDFCCEMARQMVEQLGHHPCIMSWIIQNESHTWEPGAGAFFRPIHDAFKAADPSRFTLSADNPQRAAGHLDIADVKAPPNPDLPATAEYVDVWGTNQYAGWYGGKVQNTGLSLDWANRKRAGRPMMVTEVGAEGILGERSLEMHPWTEDYQAELLCAHLRQILERDFVAGFFIWLFIDYECGSIGIRGINAKGLVDEFRRPKLAFNQVKALLAEWSAHRSEP